MQNVFDDVLIFCPEVRTGGPEALHQLGAQISRHGGRAHMVYFPRSHVEISGGEISCAGENSPMLTDFAKYFPTPLTRIRPTERTLFVFPETMCHLAAVPNVAYQRAVWWLSVDNALPLTVERLGRTPEAFLADPDLMHLYQSDYARWFLASYGARCYMPLSDYTDSDFIHRSQIASENPAIGARGRNVCYFPNKGGALAAEFLAAPQLAGSNINFVPLRDMSKAQVRDTLFAARLYIDFGGHPGKDRVPREAAVAGAVVLLHAAGAAKFYVDHPLPPAYRFDAADVASGRLHGLMRDILDEPEKHFAAQLLYRNVILRERERFETEVRALFFTGL